MNPYDKPLTVIWENDREPEPLRRPRKPHVRTSPKHPRNAPCHCGSGAKFKRCCEGNPEPHTT